MLVGFTFKAKPGKEEALKALLDDPERGQAMAEMLGATQNLLFWHRDRMVRVLSFPEGAQPPSMGELARQDPRVRAFLARIGELADPGFDPDRPETMEAFDQAVTMELLYDARP